MKACSDELAAHRQRQAAWHTKESNLTQALGHPIPFNWQVHLQATSVTATSTSPLGKERPVKKEPKTETCQCILIDIECV